MNQVETKTDDMKMVRQWCVLLMLTAVFGVGYFAKDYATEWVQMLLAFGGFVCAVVYLIHTRRVLDAQCTSDCKLCHVHGW